MIDEPVVQHVVCPSCERELPKGSLHCPYCCGDDGDQGALMRGAYIGAIVGLMVGGIVAAVYSSLVGTDNATWGFSMGVVVACVTTGLIWGVLHQRGKS